SSSSSNSHIASFPSIWWCFKRFFHLSGKMNGDHPRKLSFRYGLQETRYVSYLLQIEGKGQVVHLQQKKGIVPKDFPIFTYNQEGDLQVDYHYIRDDCFYSGFIQDKPLSSVTLSTCSEGLRGLLQLNNETYQIEPVQPSATFQHVVYRLETEEGAMHMRCGLTEEEQRHQEAVIQDRKQVAVRSPPAELWWPHKRHAEVAFVVEHERYVKFNKNETDIAMKLLETIHMVNSFFEPFLVEVSVAGLEIWTEKNLIDIGKTLGRTLKAFTVWRHDILLNHLKNDAAHLIVYRSYGRNLGRAYVAEICDNRATGVEVSRNFNLFDFSVLFAHEFGHNLGMSHDEPDCTCDRRACIMSLCSVNRIDVAGQIAHCIHLPIVLLDCAVTGASTVPLDPFAERVLVCVIFLNFALELQTNVQKMFMYKMVPLAVMESIAIMVVVVLRMGSVKRYLARKPYELQRIVSED
uniref:Peptidase M12B domain-containing protein n=1 Tax=Podarcis muralis TaxID=64176 RepID=A0A670IW95_PODMU